MNRVSNNRGIGIERCVLMSIDLSVVIPIHNGAKILKRTIKHILNQEIANLELILVENGSTDASWEICKEVQGKDTRVVAVRSKEGTSLARKEGVLCSKGKYICFCDQDDYYIHHKALFSMVMTAERTGADIIQFNTIVNNFGIKKKVGVEKSFIINRAELLDNYVGGVLGAYKASITPNVWNKIYLGKTLRIAIQDLNEALVRGEDLYFNAFAFLHPDVRSVALDTDAYYVWNSGIGTSSSPDSGILLFDEYQVIKPAVLLLAKKAQVGFEPIMRSHRETLNFLNAIVAQSILSGDCKTTTLKLIERYAGMSFVIEAAKFFQVERNDGKEWDEHIRQIADIWNIEKYYERVYASIGNVPLGIAKYKIKNVLKKTLVYLNR